MAGTAHRQLANERLLVLIGRCREAWTWLDHQLEPGPTRYAERQLSTAGQARLNQLVQAERRDRVEILRAGRVPAHNTAVPVSVAVADARAQLHTATEDAAYLVASTLRGHVVIPHRPGWTTRYRRAGHTAGQRVAGALDYLAEQLHLVDDLRTLDRIERALTQADRTARAAAGVGTDRRLLKAECPSCGRRSLAAEIGSPKPAEWAVICTRDCRCQGVTCGCKRPVRYPGARHTWPEREWSALAIILDLQDLR